ncbi:hypothetical protein C8E05_3809 [Rhodococcus wratislaviensis]|uniref:Uncharacterized protein n=1 Tax=Rhodococcus wratislaviensis TaxID=44752 RepID=A0AB38FKD2_RHOWR|nr:hypothetical protein [Rhodococcus wratislaviensis]REE74374.1 hypothetical protein C8E05_3809 [Rhodococcus wratislaviensis]SPZ42089.1 Uncharacterised protein [Rhodococcus wratislaviensis]
MKAFVALIAAVLLIGWLLHYWQAVLGAVLVGALVYAAALGGRSWWRRRADHRWQQELLADEAQRQHEQYLAGEMAGVYGNFRPVDLDRVRPRLRRLPSSPTAWRAGR